MAARLRFSARTAYAHLREVDPVLEALIETHGPFTPRPTQEHYAFIVRSILFQQLAGAAARAIQRRWYGLYGDDPERPPDPLQILATTDEAFRGAGVSRQKAGYLRDLAQRLVDGSLALEGIERLGDEEVITLLTQVRGVGRWTAEIFLMFALGRPDVLPVDDLGMRKGMQVAYGLAELPTPKRATEIGAPWAPYRTVGSWYMWRAVETVTP